MIHMLPSSRFLLVPFSAALPLYAIAVCSLPGWYATARAATAEETVRAIHGVVYATGYVVAPNGAEGTKALALDIYTPASPETTPRPALLLIHGGGFSGGDPGQMAALGRFFAERGFVCFANAYRLRPDRPDATPQAAMADTMAAVRWVRRHGAEYGARPDAIGALGYSAGAFAALAVATCDDDDYRVDGDTTEAASCRPAADIAPFNTPGVSARLQAAVIVSGGLLSDEELNAGDPPLLVIHGTRDQVVPLARGRAIYDTCLQKGLTCEFIPIERADHWPLNGSYQGRNVKEYVADFLHRHLDRPSAPVSVVAPDTSALVASKEGENAPPPASEPAPDAAMVTLDTSATRHGAVVLDPPGGRYPAGTVVKLTPVPQEGYAFAYWAGDIRETRKTCYLVMDRDRRVQAGFVARPDAVRVMLKTRTRGNGNLIVQPPLDRYVKGDPVGLEAQPGRGSRFHHWEGDAAGADPAAIVVMNGNQSVTGVFETVIVAKPEAIRLKAGRDRACLRVKGTSAQWQAATLWSISGLTVEPRGGKITVTCGPNPTGYARTTFLRLTAPELGNRYVQVPVIQDPAPAAPRPDMPVAPGVAVYRGLPGETGRLVWRDTPDPEQGNRVLTPNGDGTFTLAAPRGTATGTLTVDGKRDLQIPDGQDYHVYAAWDLASHPDLFADPDSPAELGTSYCYVGIDSGAINKSSLRFGIEWKNIGKGNEWVLRGQYESREFSAQAQNGDKAPRHIRVHVWKAHDGENGSATVHAAYSLDSGPWQPYQFTTPGHPDAYPLGLRGEDGGADLVTFKVRGLASTCLGELRVEGPGVPAVNGGLDTGVP